MKTLPEILKCMSREQLETLALDMARRVAIVAASGDVAPGGGMVYSAHKHKMCAVSCQEINEKWEHLYD